MWDFKFDAPQYYNFFRKERKKTSIELDPTDPNDIWFMQQHVELTPVRQSRNEEIIIKYKKIEIEEITMHQIKSNLSEPTKMEGKYKMNNNMKKENRKPALKPIVEKIKRSHMNEKYDMPDKEDSKMTFGHKKASKQPIKSMSFEKKHEQTKMQKISKAKSLLNLNEKSKIRMPCPYPLRVQRDWQTKSNKSWYSLSQQSAKRAMDSMKKMGENRRKSPKNIKPLRFKF